MAFATDILNQVVGQVMVRTAWGPDIVINEPFSPSPSGGTPVTALLKPEIVLYPRSDSGIASEPISFAPYGSPGPTKWPFLVVGLGLLLGVLVYRVGRR